MQSFKLKFLWVTILQGWVEFPIFLFIFALALQYNSATLLRCLW